MNFIKGFFKSHHATILAIWGVVAVFAQNAITLYAKTGHISVTDLRSIALALVLGYMRSPKDKPVAPTAPVQFPVIDKSGNVSS